MIIKSLEPFETNKKRYTFICDPCERLPFKRNGLLPSDACTMSEINYGNKTLIYFDNGDTESWIDKEKLSYVLAGEYDDKGDKISRYVAIPEGVTPDDFYSDTVKAIMLVGDSQVEGTIECTLNLDTSSLPVYTIVPNAARIDCYFSVSTGSGTTIPQDSLNIAVCDVVQMGAAYIAVDRDFGDLYVAEGYFRIAFDLEGEIVEAPEDEGEGGDGPK